MADALPYAFDVAHTRARRARSARRQQSERARHGFVPRAASASDSSRRRYALRRSAACAVMPQA